MKTKKSDLISRKQFQKLTKAEIKTAYKDLWEYHVDVLKQAGYKKSELGDIVDTEMSGWEDVCFFVGYIRGMEIILKRLENIN